MSFYVQLSLKSFSMTRAYFSPPLNVSVGYFFNGSVITGFIPPLTLYNSFPNSFLSDLAMGRSMRRAGMRGPRRGRREDSTGTNTFSTGSRPSTVLTVVVHEWIVSCTLCRPRYSLQQFMTISNRQFPVRYAVNGTHYSSS